MIDLILRFGVALHVALMVVYSSWARGGSSAYYFWALPWLALGVIEMMLLLPPKTRSDTPATATKRLIRGIFMDPITYIGLALVGYLLVQWLNGPCEMVYDSALSRWGYTDPPWPSLPFCVNRPDALQELLWFIAVLAAVLGVRHAMRPSARVFILKIFVINGALLSLLGFMQAITCPGKLFWFREIPVYFFSTFGYPNHAGTFFVMMTALSIGLIVRELGEKEGKVNVAWMALVFLLNTAGIYGSLCRASIILGTLTVVTGFIYGLIYLRGRVSKTQLVAASMLVGAIAVGVATFAFTPGSPLKKEIDTIDFTNLAAVYGSQSDRNELATAAIDIWKDYPWTGVGGYGFRYFVGMYMPEENWKNLESAGRANVHNDALQFLCEHGMIGFGLMLAMALTLVVHALLRLVRLKHVVDPDTGRRYSWFMSVSPCVWAILSATVTMAVHSTIDLPFRSIANMLMWFIGLACLPGFMPKKDKEDIVAVSAAPASDSGSEHHHHHHGGEE